MWRDFPTDFPTRLALGALRADLSTAPAMTVGSDTGQLAIVPVWLVDHPELVARDLLVYLALAAFADGRTGEAWPSRQRLAARCRLGSVRTVDAALRALERVGAVRIERRADARGSLTSLYILVRARPGVQRAAPRGAAGARGGGAAGCTLNQNQANQRRSPSAPPRSRRRVEEARFAGIPSYTPAHRSAPRPGYGAGAARSSCW